MNLYGLIGYPLSHSFSKNYFTEKFEREGLTDCRYELFPLNPFIDLASILQLHPDLKGLNVTIPYKQQVLPFLHSRQGIPPGLHACNCIRIDDGKFFGFNTDVMGFEQTFCPYLKPLHTKALILGNGGATEAVKFVLQKNNIPFKIVSRQLHPGSDVTYNDLDEKIISEYKLIINSTPLGMYPLPDDCPPIPYAGIGAGHYLFDLVYNPEKTLFLAKGEAQGALIKNGKDMLKIQADESWKIWTGDQ